MGSLASPPSQQWWGTRLMVPVTQTIRWNVVRGYRGEFPSRSNAHPNSIPPGSAPRVGTQLVALKWEWYYLALVNNPYHSRPKDSFSFSLIWFSENLVGNLVGKGRLANPNALDQAWEAQWPPGHFLQSIAPDTRGLMGRLEITAHVFPRHL